MFGFGLSRWLLFSVCKIMHTVFGGKKLVFCFASYDLNQRWTLFEKIRVLNDFLKLKKPGLDHFSYHCANRFNWNWIQNQNECLKRQRPWTTTMNEYSKNVSYWFIWFHILRVSHICFIWSDSSHEQKKQFTLNSWITGAHRNLSVREKEAKPMLSLVIIPHKSLSEAAYISFSIGR